MVEIERNPMAVRQGAAAVACMAAAAVALPVIAHRAADQRAGADTAQLASYQTDLGGDLFVSTSEPNARLQLVAERTSDGLRARGVGALVTNGADTHAMLVQAALRGSFADAAAEPDRAINPRELSCMAQAIYYEARGESYRGQVAVGEVVMNRVRSGIYPGSICGVVYQGSHRATGCQFTFTCDGSLDRGPKGPAWARAQAVARQVMLGYTRPITARATHYHTAAVDPYWSSSLIETGRVGDHIFYRFPTRAERARLVEAGLIRRAPRSASVEAAADIPDVTLDETQGGGEDAAPVAQPAPAATIAAPAADAAAPIAHGPAAPPIPAKTGDVEIAT